MFGVVSRPALVAVAAIRIEVCATARTQWILAHPSGQPTDEIVLGRMRELTDPRTRTSLASSIRVIADASDVAGFTRTETSCAVSPACWATSCVR